MPYQLRNHFGATEAVIDDNCGVSKFYAIAQTLSDDLQVTFINQVDDAESLEWDFLFNDQFLTLHYNIYGGVSIAPCKVNELNVENRAVLEVATYLVKRVY